MALTAAIFCSGGRRPLDHNDRLGDERTPYFHYTTDLVITKSVSSTGNVNLAELEQNESGSTLLQFALRDSESDSVFFPITAEFFSPF